LLNADVGKRADIAISYLYFVHSLDVIVMIGGSEVMDVAGR
jgi:hypothetical protein